MLIKRPEDIKSSEITDEKLYKDRRRFLRAAGIATVASVAGLILPNGWANPTSEAASRHREAATTPTKKGILTKM